MSTKSSSFPFTRAAFERVSAIVLTAPLCRGEFLSACYYEDALSLIATEHGLSTIEDDQMSANFDAFLDDNYEPVIVVGCYEFNNSSVLKKMDMTAYRQAFYEFADHDFVEFGRSYFMKDELDALDQVTLLGTLTKHCVDKYGFGRKQAMTLGSAVSPVAFVAALKSLCLANSAKAASRSSSSRRPLI
jgi:hypothetical protein